MGWREVFGIAEALHSPLNPSLDGLLVAIRQVNFIHPADVAQLVEHHLAKVRVASSNLVIRSSTKTQPVGWVFLLTLFRGRRSAHEEPAVPLVTMFAINRDSPFVTSTRGQGDWRNLDGEVLIDIATWA